MRAHLFARPARRRGTRWQAYLRSSLLGSRLLLLSASGLPLGRRLAGRGLLGLALGGLPLGRRLARRGLLRGLPLRGLPLRFLLYSHFPSLWGYQFSQRRPSTGPSDSTRTPPMLIAR